MAADSEDQLTQFFFFATLLFAPLVVLFFTETDFVMVKPLRISFSPFTLARELAYASFNQLFDISFWK